MDSSATTKKIVFIGDSVTAAHRNPFLPNGFGFVGIIGNLLPSHWRLSNKGKNGDRLFNLEQRWTRDVIQNSPNLVSLEIGVNDVLRRKNGSPITSDGEFYDMYKHLLLAASELSDCKIIICEPFILPINSLMQQCRDDLDRKLSIIGNLAIEMDLLLVPFDLEMKRLSTKFDPKLLVKDGVHPTRFGHQKLADFWYSKCRAKL